MALMTKIKWAVSFTAIVLALVSGTTLVVPPGKILAHDGAPELQHDGHPSETVSELKVEIVIREGGQPRLKGQKTHGQVIEVVAGQSVALCSEMKMPCRASSYLPSLAGLRSTSRVG